MTYQGYAGAGAPSWHAIPPLPTPTSTVSMPLSFASTHTSHAPPPPLAPSSLSAFPLQSYALPSLYATTHRPLLPPPPPPTLPSLSQFLPPLPPPPPSQTTLMYTPQHLPRLSSTPSQLQVDRPWLAANAISSSPSVSLHTVSHIASSSGDAQTRHASSGTASSNCASSGYASSPTSTFRTMEDARLYPTESEEDAIIESQRGSVHDMRQVCPKYTPDRCTDSACRCEHFRWCPPARFRGRAVQCRHLNRCTSTVGQRAASACWKGHFKFISRTYNDMASRSGSSSSTVDGIQLSMIRHTVPSAQWIRADVRTFDLRLLGSDFSIIMYDPPWAVNMNLPYDRMNDGEINRMPIEYLQQSGGVCFLWVSTGNIERGYRMLQQYGYRVTDEIIWVKINQLHQVAHTWPSRTGRLFNHVKEHLIIGVKQGPLLDEIQMRCGIDPDVILAEIRETSRKPDEMYNIIDRLCPRGRKLEIFGRPHNVRDGWLTVGNQMEDSHIVDMSLHARLESAYGPTLAPDVQTDKFVAHESDGCNEQVTKRLRLDRQGIVAVSTSSVNNDHGHGQSSNSYTSALAASTMGGTSSLPCGSGHNEALHGPATTTIAADSHHSSSSPSTPSTHIKRGSDNKMHVPEFWVVQSAPDNILINNYGQHFVNTGGADRPQNFLRIEPTGFEGANRHELECELARLIKSSNMPASHLRLDLRRTETLLQYLDPIKFDVAVVDPPWSSRGRTYPSLAHSTWTADEIAKLPMGQLMNDTAIVCLWTGCGVDQIDAAREAIRGWGFFPLEDIVWLQTNKTAANRTRGMLRFERSAQAPDTKTHALFRATTEHCIVGVKGFNSLWNNPEARDRVVNRCVDSDVIVSEMSAPGNFDKPVQFFEMLERLCRGRNRLHLFGTDHTIRDGWLTVSPTLTRADTFVSSDAFRRSLHEFNSSHSVPTSTTIERLRGRSPGRYSASTPTSQRSTRESHQSSPHSTGKTSLKRGLTSL